MGFKQPTPIQKACVPVGLLGKDICACAATGTGRNPCIRMLCAYSSLDLRLKVRLNYWVLNLFFWTVALF